MMTKPEGALLGGALLGCHPPWRADCLVETDNDDYLVETLLRVSGRSIMVITWWQAGVGRRR